MYRNLISHLFHEANDKIFYFETSPASQYHYIQRLVNKSRYLHFDPICTIESCPETCLPSNRCFTRVSPLWASSQCNIITYNIKDRLSNNSTGHVTNTYWSHTWAFVERYQPASNKETAACRLIELLLRRTEIRVWRLSSDFVLKNNGAGLVHYQE